MVNQIEIVIEIIIHATEDTTKILESIYELFEIKQEEFVQERLTGHFGNPILIMRIKLRKNRAKVFINKIFSKISKSQKEDFLQNIKIYFEDSSLFIRVSKEDIIRKLISLQQNDALKIKISTPVYKKSEIIKTYLELIEQ
jgi:RNA-binding protein